MRLYRNFHIHVGYECGNDIMTDTFVMAIRVLFKSLYVSKRKCHKSMQLGYCGRKTLDGVMFSGRSIESRSNSN